jgi:hypothetical protein
VQPSDTCAGVDCGQTSGCVRGECACLVGWAGTRCDTDWCLPHGHKVDASGWYRRLWSAPVEGSCACLPGAFGPRCDLTSPPKAAPPPQQPPPLKNTTSLTACVTHEEDLARAAEVTAKCCDEPSESCAGGYPATCNADCSAVLLPMVASCEAGFLSSGPFGALADTLDDAAATCALPPPPCASFDDLQAHSLAAEQACCPDGACPGDDLPMACTTSACAVALTSMQAACTPFLVRRTAPRVHDMHHTARSYPRWVPPKS